MLKTQECFSWDAGEKWTMVSLTTSRPFKEVGAKGHFHCLLSEFGSGLSH